MWGIASRGARLSERSRGIRSSRFGLAHVAARGPVEHAIVHVEGELDFASADDLVASVLAMPDHIVAIDVSGLDFVDGAGVRALLDLAQQLGEDAAIPFVGMSATVQRTFRLVARQSRSLTV